MRRLFFTILLLALPGAPSLAAVKSQTVDYSFGGKTFKGYLAWDDAVSGKRPGILVFPEWWGLNDYAKSRADQLAKAGYVAFAADLYGDGKATTHPDEAGAMVGEVRKNLQEWMGRAETALKTLAAQPNVDTRKLAAIGYCFGGSTALQLAYGGAPLRVVGSFHGSLVVPEQTQNIKARILIFHGGKDTFTSPETVAQLKTKLDAAKVDYEVVIYPNAMHGFTVPGSENAGVKGLAYNADADRRSWQQLLSVLKEQFRQ